MNSPDIQGEYAPEIVMVPLRRVGLQSKLAHDAEAWVTSMTPDADNEDGPDFWKWIVDHYHYNLIHSGTLLDTYFFLAVDSREVVATISLINDDRGVGEANSIPGIWMGGANVRGTLRYRGVASRAFAQIDALIHAVADSMDGKGLIVNLFSDVEYSERLATRHGYTFQKVLRIEHFDKEARWWCKVFRSSGGEHAG